MNPVPAGGGLDPGGHRALEVIPENEPGRAVPAPTFAELATAAYCPRQLYYRSRQDSWAVPPEVEAVRELAFEYDRLLDAGPDALAAAPIAVEPATWRRNLTRAAAQFDAWDALREPAATRRYLEGEASRGVADKVLESPAGVSLVSPGSPPPSGTWKPQRVRAVAAATALGTVREASVSHAYVEYPAHGVVRRVPLDGRRRAEYRRVLEIVRGMDGVPRRLRNRSKCGACDYRETCGVRTWTLRSLLG